MRNLLNFIIKYNYWFLFWVLEVISLILLFRFNRFQSSVCFTTANAISGKVYEISSDVTSYFYLKTLNEELVDRNMHLELEVEALRHSLRASADSLVSADSATLAMFRNYSWRKADVVNNTVTKHDNYITLDKGEADGIRPEMGVVNGTGIVGIVFLTSSHYSVVLPLLNSKSNISCKVKNRDYFGFLRWDGRDPLYANLEEIPRHARCHKGDTIVTSGYSAVFPQGLNVGRVEKIYNSADGMSYQLRVRLFTDFSRLNTVRVIGNRSAEELVELQNQLEEHTEKLK